MGNETERTQREKNRKKTAQAVKKYLHSDLHLPLYSDLKQFTVSRYLTKILSVFKR